MLRRRPTCRRSSSSAQKWSSSTATSSTRSPRASSCRCSRGALARRHCTARALPARSPRRASARRRRYRRRRRWMRSLAERIVLDCDPGHDDAIALLLALAEPELEVVGVTTVAGNQTLEKTTANAIRVLDLAGRTDIPVAAGADRPLVRDPFVAAYVH